MNCGIFNKIRWKIVTRILIYQYKELVGYEKIYIHRKLSHDVG